MAGKPNIVLIIGDDQRWDTVTAEAMPYLFNRQHKGVRFANAIASTALCAPARTSLLTGDFASRHGTKHNAGAAAAMVALSANTLATRLHDAGYYTGLIGKYLNDYELLGPPHQPTWSIPPGWDVWTAFGGTANLYSDYTLVFGATNFQEHVATYSTDLLATYARAFIRNRPVNQPYFLVVAPFGPHLGIDMQTTRYLDTMVGLPLHRPPNFNEEDVSDKGTPISTRGLIEEASYTTIDDNRQMQLEALLAVDDLVKVVDTATPRAQAKNTILIYCADQGFFWGEHRIAVGKNFPYDEAHRFPLTIVWPGTLAAREERGLVTHVDLTRTLCEWGQAASVGQDGISFATALATGAPLPRTFVPLEGWNPDLTPLYTGARTAGLKTLIWSPTQETETYDLVADPYELESINFP